MPAPLIAAALSAIAPALAKQGLDLLSGIFRGAATKGAQEVAELIEEKTGIDINDVADNKVTEEQWGQLKEFELQNQSILLEYRQQEDANDLERERMLHADRADARAMQTDAMKNDDVFVRRFIYFYATALTLLTFAFIFYASFVHQYTEANKEASRIIDTVLGFLLGVTLSAIIQYFFGSSAGSKSKEEKIKNLTESIQSDKIQLQEGGKP
ncbi:hypothetical protein [Pseudomonas chlororaphis]|uniref:hypothetical protein n=1 Tax=Pseudomonas chlororaphis TaxID=587753 RepID=UPI001B30AF70|nr:hypothetical protein [Pseudomonas chlororaphis]QTT89383.1 hypothetical protein HUT28_19035 [Pseudomonas chlororaphis]